MPAARACVRWCCWPRGRSAARWPNTPDPAARAFRPHAFPVVAARARLLPVRGRSAPSGRRGGHSPPEGIWTEMKGRLGAAGWLTAAWSGVRMYSLRYGFRYRIRHSHFPPLTRVKPAFSIRCGKVPRRTPVGDHPLQEACEGKAACDDQMGLVMDGGGERSLAESPNPKTADHADQGDRLVHFPCPYVAKSGKGCRPCFVRLAQAPGT